jgi:hypothetical protein
MDGTLADPLPPVGLPFVCGAGRLALAGGEEASRGVTLRQTLTVVMPTVGFRSAAGAESSEQPEQCGGPARCLEALRPLSR